GDAFYVFFQRGAADLDLEEGVAAIEMAAHLVEKIGYALAGRIPAAADIAEHAALIDAVAIAVGDQLVGRDIGDLGDRVPDCVLDGADTDGALEIAARLLAEHHRLEDEVGVEGGRVEAGLLLRRAHQAWDEAGAHLRTAGVAAG